MPGKLSFVYWPIKGLGAAPRMALHYAGVAFDDVPIEDHEKWFGPDTVAMAKTNPLVNLPHLILEDGEVVVQSGAILRHIARTYDMYGANEAEMARVDQGMDVIVDLRAAYSKMAYVDEGDEWEEAKKNYAGESITYYIGGLDKFRNHNGTKYIAADTVTIADMVVVENMEASAAAFDSDVKTTFAAYPALVAYHAELAVAPRLQAYHDSPMAQVPLNGPFARFSAVIIPE